MRDRLPSVVNTPELRFACSESRKFEVVREVRERLRRKGAEMTDLDALRVRPPGGWWLLRASNTQAVLGPRAGSATPDGRVHPNQRLPHHLTTCVMREPRA